MENPSLVSPRIIGRYALYDEIAAGGMATVHLGRLLGPVGFSRTVAIKRLHPQYSRDPEFVSMLLDEARLAARIRHPNVVSILDVVTREGEIFLVMDYVQGETFSRLVRAQTAKDLRVPVSVAVGVMINALHGLHAAHEAKSERGQPLEIVHRDVSPQNIMVGVDGVARVLDFGVAVAAERLQTTRAGHLKGKNSYIAPEQLRLEKIDRRVDIYAAAVVLWEALVGRKLFEGQQAIATVFAQILKGDITPPSRIVRDSPRILDPIIMKGLALNPADRWATAKEFAVALERVMPPATPHSIGEWVESIAGDALQSRADQIADVESNSAIVFDAAKDMSALATSLLASESPFDPGETTSTKPDLDHFERPTERPRMHHHSDKSGSNQMIELISSSNLVPDLPAAPAKPHTIRLVLLGAALAFVAGGGLVWYLGTKTPGSAVAVQPAESIARVVSSAPQPPESARRAEPTASQEPVEIEVPKLQPTASPDSTKASTPAKADAPRHQAAPAHAAPKTNCSPPYTIDKNGFHVPKAECL